MEKFGKRSQADDIKSILWNFWLDFAGKLSSGLEFEFFRRFVLSHLAYGVPLVPLWRWAPLRSPPPQSPSWPEGRGRSPVVPRDPDRSPSTRRRRVERLFDPGLKKSFRCIIFWKKAGRGDKLAAPSRPGPRGGIIAMGHLEIEYVKMTSVFLLGRIKLDMDCQKSGFLPLLIMCLPQNSSINFF